MHSPVFQLFLGRRPGRKRCPLPEILNPNVHSANSAGGNKQSILVVILLGLMFLCTHQYLVNFEPGTPKQTNQVQTHPRRNSDAADATVGDLRGHLRAVSGRASVPDPAAKNKAAGQTLEPPIWMADLHSQAALSSAAVPLWTRHQQLGLGHHHSHLDFQSADVLASDDVDEVLFKNDASPTEGGHNQEALRTSQYQRP
jgi:hypothetical protein